MSSIWASPPERYARFMCLACGGRNPHKRYPGAALAAKSYQFANWYDIALIADAGTQLAPYVKTAFAA